MNIPELGGGGTDYAHAAQYRWLLTDPVPFTDGLKVEIENYNRTYGGAFGATTFWYATPEPGTTLLLLASGGILMRRRRRRDR